MASTSPQHGVKPALVAYVGSFLAFCALDFAWLSVMAPRFYQDQVGPLLLASPQWQPGLVFYLLYVIGLVVFCVMPALRSGPPATHPPSHPAMAEGDLSAWSGAALRGALFGLVAYATYDLSNLATLKGWTLPLSMVDMCWGAVASALASTCGYLASKKFGQR